MRLRYLNTRDALSCIRLHRGVFRALFNAAEVNHVPHVPKLFWKGLRKQLKIRMIQSSSIALSIRRDTERS